MLGNSRKRTEGNRKIRTRTKGWTPERRREQARRIRRQKPWRFSTGPRTVQGKIKSSLNSYKHGDRRYMWREFRRVMAKHRRFLREIKLKKIILPRHPVWFEEFLLRHPRAGEDPAQNLSGYAGHQKLDSRFRGNDVCENPADFAVLHQGIAKRYTVIHED